MTIREYTEQAVRKYLRTVLFVDDHLFPDAKTLSESSGSDLSSLNPVANTFNRVEGVEQGGSQATTHDGEGRPSGNTSSDIQEEMDTSSLSQDVVDGFAKQGIVCGLYQPSPPDFSTGDGLKQILTLCTHADVFILDWKLKKTDSKGLVALELLEKLFKDDERLETPKPIRFCGIYTHRRLGSVYRDLQEAIQRKWPSKYIMGDPSVWLIRLEGMTIRLYRKNNQTEAENKATRFVTPGDLAETIIQDFIAEYEGIMSATALRGIAEVRDNANRILDKFPPSLDYGLAIHSGLTIANPTVPEDLSDLLADEIRSILDDAAPNEDIIHEMLATKIEQLSDSLFSNIALDTNMVNPGTTDATVKEYFVKLFRKEAMISPFNKSEVDCDNHKIGLGFLEKLQALALSAAQSRDYAAGNLSKLFCQRTVYGDVRVLKPGTVVLDSQKGGYYLCLMPLCDSVRLKQSKVVFPFWKLAQIHRVTEEAASSNDSNAQSSVGTGTSHGLIISEKDGETKLLCVKGKIKDRMSLWTFKANKVVQFTKEGSSFFISEALSGGNENNAKPQNQGNQSIPAPKKFEWVAELKPLHAQRMAEYVSRQFSRVGLAESEWLRLHMDR